MRPLCSCGRLAEISFKKKDGTIIYKAICRTCRGRVENIENKKAISKQYYWDNKEYCLQKGKEWRIANPDKVRENNINSRNQRAEYAKQRIKVDISFKLSKYLRSRLYNALKNNQKKGSAVKDLGCSIKEFKIYLENHFQVEMSWDNYGEWHIDHIMPLASFDLTDREQLLKACHYTNLQPLWAEDNLKKSSKQEEHT